MSLSGDEKYGIGRRFHTALATVDRERLRSLLHDEAVRCLPGGNAVSGRAEGGGHRRGA
ncbi:hypothetical protein [Streptomyces sp. NPDC005731]|uniref:hypothetical protein n=1 Tax=Streptomyces sp. NPDC005731 TaxID=3157056 RepID=UPI0033FB746B